MKTLGTKISELRKSKGLTQEQLAIQLNVSSQAVSKWETNLSIPDLPILIELSNIFNVTLDELIKQQERQEIVKVIEPEQRKPINQMMLRIIVNSSDGDKVRVNLPMAIIKVGLEIGMKMPEVNGNVDLKGVDFEQILALVEQGVVGKLVEVESADGDLVEIFVE